MTFHVRREGVKEREREIPLAWPPLPGEKCVISELIRLRNTKVRMHRKIRIHENVKITITSQIKIILN